MNLCVYNTSRGASWAVLACGAAIAIATPAAVRGNVLYDFNQDEQGWSSTSSPAWLYTKESANEGSWKAFCNGEVSVRYLYSPCLEINNPSFPKPSSIDVDFQHRFHFQDNPAGEPFWGAGQVQYMLNASGTWLGITGWESSGTELAPTLSVSGTSAYVPPLLSPGDAFVGTSPKYANSGGGGVYDKSSFQISGLAAGDEIKFRFAAAMFVSGSCPSLIDPLGSNPIWEVDDFEVKGVVEAECVPEPTGFATLLGACVTWLGWRGRERARAVLAASGGHWPACLVSALAIALLTSLPAAEAVPIVNNEFDFATGPLGWTPTPVGKLGLTPPATGGKRWTHVNGEWKVNWSPVSGPLVATGNYLTSPLLDPAGPLQGLPVDAFRISFSHKFNFSSSLTVPPAAGQIVYSINGGPFLGLPQAAWSTGNVNTPEPLFGPNPLWPTYVGQTTLVVPDFTPPTGSYSDLFPLVNGGASFTGVTPGYSNTGGTYVPSVAVLDIPLQVITDFRVRLINANLGSNCPADAGWDVRYLQVDFAAPEPGSFILAAAGISGVAGYRLLTRKRRESAVQ